MAAESMVKKGGEGAELNVSFLTLIVTKTIQGRRAIILRHLVNSVCVCVCVLLFTTAISCFTLPCLVLKS